MAEQQIHPHKVTKPIQLLAAWLVGLVLIDGMFLMSALQIENGWERPTLVIAAIANVPLFLAAMFILQTKFRAELQDDPHYSDYINKKTAQAVSINPIEVALEAKEEALERRLANPSTRTAPIDRVERHGDPRGLDWSKWKVAMNDHLPKFDEIRGALKQAGIPVSDIFGSADLPKSKPPSRWVVSISEAMPFENKLALLRVLAPFGLDGFQLWSPVREAGEEEDVYIGSYGVSLYSKFTPELSTLLESGMDEIDFDRYRRKNKVRTTKPRFTNVSID